MLNLSTLQLYKPLKNPRRPELMAWIFSIGLMIVLFALPSSGFFLFAGILFAVFFFLAAVIMSIANWANRKTELRISEDAIRFFNGVKETKILWGDIIRVEVYTGRFNDKINVISDSDSFNFDVFKTGDQNSNTGNSVGFEAGDEILQTIFKFSNIDAMKKLSQQGYYYYSVD